MIRHLCAVSFVAICLCSGIPAFAEGPFRDLSFDAAVKAAEAEKKIVFIDFYTTWCGPCKMLDKTTWKDEKVIEWFKTTAVGIKIDAEKEEDLAKKFKVASYPTLILLKPEGKEIDRLSGYRDAETFLADVNAALDGKDSLTRARAEAADSPTDYKARMDYGRELARRGRHEEALKEFLWCFDEGEKHNSGFSGVRVSFLLSDIVRLGKEYPPALEALRERRDRNEEKVLRHFRKLAAKVAQNSDDGADPRRARAARLSRFSADGTIRDLTSDSIYLSKNLDEPERVIAFYDKLKAIGDVARPFRSDMVHYFFDSLAEKRRYKDILADGASPLDEIDQRIAMWEWEKVRYRKDKERGKEMEAMRHGYIVRDIARQYEVLVGAGEYDDADKAARKLVEFDKSALSYSELIKGAIRAGSRDLARELEREAKRELSGDEQERLVGVEDLDADSED